MRPFVLLLLAFTAADVAADEFRRTVLLNVVVRPVAHSFDEDRTLTLFAEKGSVATRYSSSLSPGVELGLQHGVSRRLAVRATAGAVQRGRRGEYTARLPHPLYLDKHRVSGGALDRLSYREAFGHLGMAYTGQARLSGRALGYTLFLGPSLYSVDAELVDRATTDEAYPYDEVTFSLSTLKARRTAPGGHAGGSLAYSLGRRLALGVDGRYGYGRVSLKPKDGDVTEVAAGGLQLGLGLRWSF